MLPVENLKDKMTNKEVYNTNKLLRHPERIAEWKEKGVTPPITVDIDLTDKCNNRCPMCHTHTFANNATIPLEDARSILRQCKDLNVKSITLAGGGDPSCHPDYANVLRSVKELGMEVATQTNGYTLTNDMIEAIVESCTWGRVSLDADGPKIYRLTHGMGEKAFNRVVKNIEKIANAKKRLESKVVFGTTYLLGTHTLDGIYGAAKLSKGLGVDGIRFRTFHTDKINFTEDDERKMADELERSSELENKNFFVSYSHRCESGFGDTKREHKFKICYFPHFLTAIAANQKMYTCCIVFKGLEKYCIGDLSKNTLRDIWFSEERKESCKKIDLNDCPNPCTFEGYAEHLWGLTQEMPHENYL